MFPQALCDDARPLTRRASAREGLETQGRALIDENGIALRLDARVKLSRRRMRRQRQEDAQNKPKSTQWAKKVR